MRFDSEKLSLHPKEVWNWWVTGDHPPLSIEVSPTDACNQRCYFCAFEYLESPKTLSAEALFNLKHHLMVRSVLLAGDGEPLLALDNCLELMRACAESDVAVGIYTNGELDFGDPKDWMGCAFIRFSINHTDADAYREIHGRGDVRKVMENMEMLCDAKIRYGSKVVIGAQVLRLKENVGDAPRIASALRKTGIQYVQVKPFNPHPRQRLQDRSVPWVGDEERRELLDLRQEDFDVIIRDKAVETLGKRGFKHCLAAPFHHLVTADGNVWPCTHYVGMKEFSYGNLNRSTFSEIVYGHERRSLIKYLAKAHNVEKCRRQCRLEQCNWYLSDLVSDSPHKEFI